MVQESTPPPCGRGLLRRSEHDAAPKRLSSLAELHCDLTACRRCAEAGYFIGSTPIFSSAPGAVFMTVGQAPGRHEADVTHLPFSGRAGRRLFRWLAQSGFDEAEFRATQAMTAITKCYPGPHPGGRGDRVASREEQALCAPWLEREIAVANPKVLILIGGLAIGRFLGRDQPMTGLVGTQFVQGGRTLVALPHPSGASQWFNRPENKARLAQALQILARLREEWLGGRRGAGVQAPSPAESAGPYP